MNNLGTWFLWLKSFHIVFVIAWFAGIFYLPRLFVYHAQAEDTAVKTQFKIMERRLFAMMTFGAAFALALGVATIAAVPGYLESGWFHAKFTLVLAVIGYHVWCYRLIRAFSEDRNVHSARWYRIFNEAPLLLLIAIVVLVVVKPF